MRGSDRGKNKVLLNIITIYLRALDILPIWLYCKLSHDLMPFLVIDNCLAGDGEERFPLFLSEGYISLFAFNASRSPGFIVLTTPDVMYMYIIRKFTDQYYVRKYGTALDWNLQPAKPYIAFM